MSTLPNTLSALILVALADLEACERDPDYEIDMYQWHTPSLTKGTCSVCLAGAVMAKSLDFSRFQESSVYWFSAPAAIGDKMKALNYVRMGKVGMALWQGAFGVPTTEPFQDMSMPDYATDPQGFKTALRTMASTLASHNL